MFAFVVWEMALQIIFRNFVWNDVTFFSAVKIEKIMFKGLNKLNLYNIKIRKIQKPGLQALQLILLTIFVVMLKDITASE